MPEKKSGPRPRTLLLILLTQAVIIGWVADSEIARGVYLICYSLMTPTVLYLLLARALRRWLPFENNELLLAYIVLTATIPIVGFGGLSFLMQGMGYLSFVSGSQPEWVKFVQHLAGMPLLHDPKAIQGLYLGRTGVPWHAWLTPIAFWSVYLLLLSGIWLCLAGILRRVWIHQERLTFPITTLPLQMMDPRDDIFRRPIFWAGFAIPALLQSLLALHEWFPAVPAVQLKAMNIAPMVFTTPPWNAIPAFNIGFYPIAIGLAYFVPSQVSFSCWFLYVLMTLVYVAGAMFGVEGTGAGVGVGVGSAMFPYPHEQATGAWLAFAGIILWGARSHLRTVMKSLPVEERNAMRRLPALALLCALACAGMMVAVGVRPVVALGIVGIYVAYTLTGARIRAVAGGQWTFAPLWTPHHITASILGTRGMGDQSLIAGGHFDLIHVDIRAQSLPYLMEGLCIAERTGIRWKTILTWVAAGTVTALILGWWFGLTKLYSLGASTAKTNPYPLLKAKICFDGVNRLATAGGHGYRAGALAMLFGAGLTLLLTWTRGLGVYGLHPIGYALCNTLIIRAFAVPFFLAWLVKVIVLRWGGSRAYHRSVPFFVGVILGDIVAQGFWTILASVLNLPVYQFLT
ncbi:MAG: hypothetical protein Q7T82_11890 [Armatimonadota bacterium]|nr:hypothetical protein [Armatimonadota bacterium]